MNMNNYRNNGNLLQQTPNSESNMLERLSLWLKSGFNNLRSISFNASGVSDFVLASLDSMFNLNNTSSYFSKVIGFLSFLLWILFSLVSLLNLTLAGIADMFSFIGTNKIVKKIKGMVPVHFLLILTWVFAYMVSGIHKMFAYFLLFLTSIITIMFSIATNTGKKYLLLTAGFIQFIFSLMKLGFLNDIIKNEFILVIFRFSTIIAAILILIDYFMLKKSNGKGMGDDDDDEEKIDY